MASRIPTESGSSAGKAGTDINDAYSRVENPQSGGKLVEALKDATMAVLTGILGIWYGVTGAGVAFGSTLSVVALMFLFAANSDISAMMTSTNESNRDLTS